jgi:type I restriction enzyme S subunit
MSDLINQHLDIWTSAIASKATAGRGTSTPSPKGEGRGEGNPTNTRNAKVTAYGIKKLRELILELAVRGKLVPQDPNDEPAKELLEKIRLEKSSVNKQGKNKKEPQFLEISDAEKPYKLPPGWEWERLGNLFEIQDSLRIPVNSADRKTREGKFPYYGANGQVGFIDDYIFEGERILIAEDGGFFDDPIRGVAYLVQGKFWVNNHAHVLKCICATNSKYWISYLNRLDWKPLVRGMTRDKLNQATMIQIVMAVPPLSEQHRIAAKVDELMALCDQLEQQQTDHIAAHQTLVQTLLDTLTQAAAAEFERAWSRIADHFDTLFTTESSIDQLKQTLLQLAVMGKLVPQDPNDEPSTALLQKIVEKKARLVKKGEIKKQKPLPDIEESEIQYEAPNGWEWCRLQEIVFLLGDGLHGTPEYTDNEKFYFINGNNLNNGQILIKPETKTVAKDQYEKHKKQLGENSVLVSINGTLGNVAFYNNEEIILGKSACYFNLAEKINKRFIKVVIDAPSFLIYAHKNATGSTIKNLGLSAMNSLPIALPPIQEQHRIVAKVDELMGFCDALKARIAAAQTTQLQLADAIVEQSVT